MNKQYVNQVVWSLLLAKSSKDYDVSNNNLPSSILKRTIHFNRPMATQKGTYISQLPLYLVVAIWLITGQ